MHTITHILICQRYMCVRCTAITLMNTAHMLLWQDKTRNERDIHTVEFATVEKVARPLKGNLSAQFVSI